MQVKTAALLLLTLKAADRKQRAEIGKAGSWLVVSQQMLLIGQAAHAAHASSDAQAGQQNTKGAAADHEYVMVRESEVFLEAGRCLLHDLGYSSSLGCKHIRLSVMQFCASFAVSSCQLSPPPTSQQTDPRKFISRILVFFAEVVVYIRFFRSLCQLTSSLMPFLPARPPVQRRRAQIIGSQLHDLHNNMQRCLQTRAGSGLGAAFIEWQCTLMQPPGNQQGVAANSTLSRVMKRMLPCHISSQQQKAILTR